MNIVILDVETTSLDKAKLDVWEVAALTLDSTTLEEKGDRLHYLLKPKHLEQADAGALSINHFYERAPHMESSPSHTAAPLKFGEKLLWSDEKAALHDLARYTAGTILGGLNIGSFDAVVLEDRLRGAGLAPAWHHRFVEVGQAARQRLAANAGGVPDMNVGTSQVAKELGVAPNGAEHTAMGDVLWTADLLRAAWL